MILLRPSFKIEAGTFGKQALQRIETAARTCYKSEPKGDPIPFVGRLISSGHESTIEHVSFTVRFVIDRGISHELVRARLCSFSQESTRYVDYNGHKTKGQCQFIIPPWVQLTPGYWEYLDGDFYRLDNQGSRKRRTPCGGPADLWLTSMFAAQQTYQDLRCQGWTPQQARSVLPNSTKTEIVVTANIRQWRNVLKQRTAKPAHPQMREVMVPLLKKLQKRTPVLFDDIIPYEETIQ